MTIRSIIVRVVCSGLLTACQPWSHSKELIERDCGQDIAAYTDSRKILKILQPGGQELEPHALYELKAAVQHESQTSEPFISSRGCLALSKAEGQVEVQVLKQGWAAVQKLDESWGMSRYKTITLRKTEPLKVTLDCPSEGVWAANDSLKQPLGIQTPGEPELFEIDLRAVDSDGREISLYSKKMGEKDWNISETLDLRGLEEKLYSLITYQKDLSRQLALTAGQGCALAVMRQPPAVDGLRQQGPTIVKEGSLLPWVPSVAGARLHVCREPYDEAQNRCTPTSSCRDPSAFVLKPQVKAEKAGLWKYFAYAEDAARNRSELSCQLLIITSSQPQLQLNWRDPALRGEQEPLLRAPTPILALDLAAFHATVPQDQLLPNLECRAELLVKGLGAHPGTGVRCLSGACKNQTLEEFRPCSQDLEISITQVLGEANLLDSRLRIIARVHDGAGGTAEKSRDLWLRKDVWGAIEQQPPALQEKEAPRFEQLLDLGNNQLLAAENGRTQLWNGSSWKALASPFDQRVIQVNFVQLDDLSVVARFRLAKGADDYETEDHFASLEGETWRALSIAGWDPAAGYECGWFIKLESGELSCSTPNFFMRFDKMAVLERTEDPEASDDGLCSWPDDSGPALRNRQGRWYLFCRFGVLTHDADGKLINIDLPGDVERVAEGSKVFDGHGRLWLILHKSPGKPITIGYVDGTTFHSVPTPMALEPGYSSLTLARNDRGDIQFQDAVWNEETGSWHGLADIRRIFPSGSLRVKRMERGGMLYENPYQILLVREGRQFFIPKRGLDFFRHGAVEQALVLDDSSLWLRFASGTGRQSNVLRMQSIRFIHWGANALNLPHETIQHMGYSPDGELVVRLLGSGYFSFRDGRWNALAENADLLVTATFNEGERIWAAGHDRLLAYNRSDQSWVTVWKDGEAGTMSGAWFSDSRQTPFRDRDGRLWFIKSSGKAITESAGQWSALDPLAAFRPVMADDSDDIEFSFESVTGVDLVNGYLGIATNKAFYQAQGTSFSKVPWPDWGIQGKVVGAKALGQGLFAVTLDGQEHVHLGDARLKARVRSVDWSHLLVGDPFIGVQALDAEHLILATRNHIYLETSPGEWISWISIQRVRELLKNESLSFEGFMWLSPDRKSLWLTVYGNNTSEVIQVFLP